MATPASEAPPFSDDARFSNATFSGDVDFTEATFNGDVTFSYTTFNVNSTFYGAIFNGVIFSGDADFTEATFNGDAHFRATRSAPHNVAWPSGWALDQTAEPDVKGRLPLERVPEESEIAESDQ
ncbi:pentapeptide repeat-containing protein [Actinomycetospora lutea]|uniref:pentapeptide repeat-containing protein n=1 Tax=Actinomycetospora lutea TaxID=663604 RepID=UPI0023666851|nr:pentapeptide repeat-containing protein [Actinomycetospora lutea]MDD7942019.1 pentapeptide repeat-containing protein [Actinomycetospora lutea]